MQTQGYLIVVAVVTFSLAELFQKRWIGRAMERIINDDAMAETSEDWAKLTRQDVAGILLALMTTNGLLAAILAVLVFR